MPVTNKIGHSKATKDKANGFEKIISQLLNTVKTITNKPENYWASKTFQYIDTNAGAGFNEDEECDGSPVIFLRAAEKIQIPYIANFIDIEKTTTDQLSQRIDNWDSYQIHTGNNKIVVSKILDTIPANSYGVLYHDPNGVPDFDLLTLASQHPALKCVDILVRYAASSVKRTQHITGKKMLDYLNGINKKYWMVREVERGDKWQWTFLLGLNWNGLTEWRTQGFHYAHSKTGQAIIEQLNFTNAEQFAMKQPSLFSILDRLPEDGE